ncbi:antistasin, partial [Biomphalaria pfeifferi]
LALSVVMLTWSVSCESFDQLCPVNLLCNTLACLLRCSSTMSDNETECLDCLCGAHHSCDCTRRMPLPPVSLTSYLKVRHCVITEKCRAKCASSPCKTGTECNNGGCSSCDDQTPRCPGLKCSLNCPNGFVLDSSGCPICRCKCPATPTICLMGKICTIDLLGCNSCICGISSSFPFLLRPMFLS